MLQFRIYIQGRHEKLNAFNLHVVVVRPLTFKRKLIYVCRYTNNQYIYEKTGFFFLLETYFQKPHVNQNQGVVFQIEKQLGSSFETREQLFEMGESYFVIKKLKTPPPFPPFGGFERKPRQKSSSFLTQGCDLALHPSHLWCAPPKTTPFF